jgi:hypothetical protein
VFFDIQGGVAGQSDVTTTITQKIKKQTGK